MAISHKGFHVDVLTFNSNSRIQENVPVTLHENDNCTIAQPGSDFIGIAVHYRDGLVGVQTEGYVEVAYSGEAPSFGYCGLVSGGNNGVKKSDSGQAYRVIKVDTENKNVGFLL